MNKQVRYLQSAKFIQHQKATERHIPSHVHFHTLKQEHYMPQDAVMFLHPHTSALPCHMHTAARQRGQGHLVLLQENSEASLKLRPRKYYKCFVREAKWKEN